MPKLIVIPTPIGNLEDTSKRVKDALAECSFLLVEDTRQSGKLLNLLNISNKMVSYHQHNEHKVLSRLIEEIRSAEKVGLISDAGMPGISDPGFLLIRECLENDIEVECLPGPTSLIPALVVSGLPMDRFVFEGFLPVKKGRKKRLDSLTQEERTMIFFESPYRVGKTIRDFAEAFGEDRLCSVSRELTKKFEETKRGRLVEMAEEFPPDKTNKGEIVIVVEGKKA